jgi:hypothetical protein
MKTFIRQQRLPGLSGFDSLLELLRKIGYSGASREHNLAVLSSHERQFRGVEHHEQVFSYNKIG